MEKTNRRKFIKQTSAGLARAATLNWSALARAAQEGPVTQDRSLVIVPGVHAYTSEKSVAAGQSIDFHVSSTVPYRASICRLGLDVDQPDGDEVLHEFGQSLALPQAIHPGSYIRVEKGLPEKMGALSLECWVRPWKTDAQYGLITQFDYPSSCGYGLFLNAKGGATIYLGDGDKHRPEFGHDTKEGLIAAGKWHHLVATFDGVKVALWLNGTKVGHWSFFPSHPAIETTELPMRLGASGEVGAAAHFLDGDLAMPVVYRRALTDQEIEERFNGAGLSVAKGNEVLACWPLDEEQGSRVEDASSFNRHGVIVNHGTWMVGGPSFDADVPRYSQYDPAKDPRRGHGLRLASDDLYDCGWSVTHQYKVPAQARPGIYVGRFHYEMDGQPRVYHTTFVVKKPRRRKRAPLLVLCASNTWLAYNGTPFGVNGSELKQVWGTGGTDNSPGDPPAFNFYRAHASGQGTCQVGLKMPWPAAGPYIHYGGPTQYSHLMRAERFAHVWLEKSGYQFDVITDLDLHRDPEQLRGYQTVLINGHSEYWSINMFEGLKDYLARGGNVVCLSGNSLFWRVSYNAEGTILECRKVDAPGDQLPGARRGECWHSQDGLRGGLMRECGFPGWTLVGLETLGWNNQSNPEQFGPYLVDRPDHFLFHQPLEVDVQEGDPIGQASDGGLPRANGHEIDVRLSTLKAIQEAPSPAGGVVPSDPPGMVRLANGVIPWKKGGAAFDYFFRPVKPAADQGGEMIYWERQEGGKVFNAGSIGAGWALHADPKFQRLLTNVLSHFGVNAGTGVSHAQVKASTPGPG